MAGIKVKGLDEIRRTVQRFDTVEGIKALQAAQMAAAKAMRNAIKAAAPRGKTGKLRASVKIFRSRPKGMAISARDAVIRMLVGPEKAAYYAYFLAKGWKSPLGKAQTFATRRGRKFTTRRLARSAAGFTHSQRGLGQGRSIAAPYPDWLAKAGDTAEQKAIEAFQNTYKKKLKEAGLM